MMIVNGVQCSCVCLQQYNEVMCFCCQTLKFQNRLNEILDQISGTPATSEGEITTQTASGSDDDEDEGLSISTRRASPQPGADSTTQTSSSVPVYEMQFPQLFVHQSHCVMVLPVLYLLFVSVNHCLARIVIVRAVVYRSVLVTIHNV